MLNVFSLNGNFRCYRILRSRFGSAIVAGVLGLPAGYFGLKALNFATFLVLPFVVGGLARLLYQGRDGKAAAALLGAQAIGVTGLSFIAFGWEGLICVAMSAPLAVPAAALGALSIHHLSTRAKRLDRRPYLASAAVLPLLVLAENQVLPESPVFAVETSVEIEAPPERVWRYVIQFSDLEPPAEALFRMGLAYPIRAEIDGRGVGAIRRCVFSTGEFVEPITVWDEPRVLAFTVESGAPPMEEWTPYEAIHPPHLEGYLKARRGEFRLEPLPGGRTRLIGTSWYSHGMRPGWYWKLWSDEIIHRIHLRVMRQIAREAEAPQPPEES